MVPPCREQRSLVDEVREIRSDHARCRGRDATEVDVGPERHAPRVHFEDRLPAGAVGRLHRDPPVEPARAKQGLVEHVGPVGRADDDHAGGRVESVHLGEDLVQRLLSLVTAAEAATRAASRAADRVELVDEDDGRRLLLRLPEEVADA